jgi:hypothetical protein
MRSPPQKGSRKGAAIGYDIRNGLTSVTFMTKQPLGFVDHLFQELAVFL